MLISMISLTTITAQVILTEDFEHGSSCDDEKSFYDGCFNNWININGSASTLTSWEADGLELGTAYQGNRFVQMYSQIHNSLGCGFNNASEGIALEYDFEIGKTYKIKYAMRWERFNIGCDLYKVEWVLSNDRVNQYSEISNCASDPTSDTPEITGGDQVLMTYTNPSGANQWNYETLTFTPEKDFKQLWLRNSSSLSSPCLDEPIVSSFTLLDKFELIACEDLVIDIAPIKPSYCSPKEFVIDATGSSGYDNMLVFVKEVEGEGESAGMFSSGAQYLETFNEISVLNMNELMAIECGKWYKVMIALSNSCNGTTDETTFIEWVYIACPTADYTYTLGGDICKEGEKVYLCLDAPEGVIGDFYWTLDQDIDWQIVEGDLNSPSVCVEFLLPDEETSFFTQLVVLNGCGKATSKKNIAIEKDCPCEIISVDIGYQGYTNTEGSFSSNIETGSGTSVYYVVWSFGDGNYSKEFNPSHEYKEGGIYKVCLRVFAIDADGNKCETTYCENVNTIISKKSTKRFGNTDLIIFPNPSVGSWKLSGVEQYTENVTIKVFNVNGQIVYHDLISSGEDLSTKTFDTTHLSGGIYFVNISTSNGFEEVKKLIIQ